MAIEMKPERAREQEIDSHQISTDLELVCRFKPIFQFQLFSTELNEKYHK